jgi:hypothetical protein
MSSIRVKRSRYDTLRDTTASNVIPHPLGTFPRNIARIFTPSRPRSASEADVSRTPNVTFADLSNSPPSTASRSPIIPSGRPRSNSRVSHHILNRRSITSLRAPLFQDQRPSRENSQISLAAQIQPQLRDGGAANVGDGVEEDIVEHLDVIGTYYFGDTRMWD